MSRSLARRSQTMKFINQATLAMDMMFARGHELGSMVDILGVGVIIRGESGIGKTSACWRSSNGDTASCRTM